jgi:hypothetical protein
MRIAYNKGQPESRLREALAALGEEYPLADGGTADAQLTFRRVESKGRSYRIRPEGSGLLIEYADVTCALRALGTVLARGAQSSGAEEQIDFQTFGIMLDCSRNAVMTVAHFKQWLRRLALLGFNMAMLYTEDTYRLDGEPFFGYQRGAYTADELREVDTYARRLGIEMIPCIQTLGHLTQILKWAAYQPVKDTTSVLLAGEPKTYELIEKMIRHWSGVFASRRIHIGMDEAHDLGRGQYLDRFGYRNGFEIFNEHLGRVVELCEKHGYRPMIWSDMYFRLGSKAGDYYDRQSVVPDAVKAKIPRQVQLVYWDYYHTEEAFYTDWIARHRALGFEPIMGSGVWTWCALWHAANYTEPKAGACVRACRKAGLKEIFFTMWGDDGAMCDFNSALAGLTYVAELAYAGRADDGALAARFAAVCGGDYSVSRLAGQLSFFEPVGVPDGDQSAGIWAWPTLWDDPLLGIYWNDKRAQIKDGWSKALTHYRGLAERLRDAVDRQTGISAGDLAHARLLADLLAKKIQIRAGLEEAYTRRDSEALKKIAQHAESIIERLAALDASYRRQWLRRNKPFGLEVVQVRIAGLARRYRELADRIGELVEGKIDRIHELEDIPTMPAAVHPAYRTVSTPCVPFD